MGKFKVLKLAYLFVLPFAVEIYQNIKSDSLNIDYAYLLMAIIASLIGSSVRIGYEAQKKKVEKKRVWWIVVCSVTISYLVYIAFIEESYAKYMGGAALVGGIISIDIIKFFIEDLLSILKQVVKKKLDATEKKEDNFNELD